MIFLEKISKLSHSACNKLYAEESNAVFIGLCDGRPDHAKHIIFRPMSESLIGHLVQSYARNFPKELISIYREMNGADLFWTSRYVPRAKIHIPFCMFSLYGIPCSDSRKNTEPFNISIEDLNRAKDTPAEWLKFGSYYEPKTYSHKRDLYIDTEDKKVYSVDHDSESCNVLRKWLSIDACLCEVFDLLNEVYD